MTDPTPNAPMPTPLSPAAQAVLDAYGHCLGSYEARVNTTRPGVTRLADALCAVALYLDNDCQQLIAIAIELEGQ
jgi:hypothetical protein